jgi:N-acyl-D-aspartate/D-glutamate deacylase
MDRAVSYIVAERDEEEHQRMSRTILYGGRIFDGTGSPIADGDVAFEDGRIVAVGTGLDGDDGVDVATCT